MSFAQTVAKAWKNEHLLTALFELTYHCNLDCFFCYNDRTLQGKPLDYSDYESILIDLQKLQCPSIVLSGGEPLSSPHFFKMGAKAHEMGFSIRIKSNGHSWTKEISKRIKTEMDPFIVELSLHGATAEIHDRQTRKDGSFKRLVTNARHMKDAGLRMRFNSTLTAYNEDQVEAMFNLADDIGLFLRFDPEVTARDDGSQDPLSISPSAHGLANLLSIELKRSDPPTSTPTKIPTTDRHCGAGSSGLVVDPFGTILPCVQWRTPIGNIREKSLMDIWTDHRVRAIRQESKNVKSWLHGLPAEDRPVSFCPGVAKVQTGSTKKIHPGLAQRHKEIRKQKKHLPIIH